MKLAFIGSHGVGKTTLCFDLASRVKRLDLAVDIVREVARSCPLPINRETTMEAQAWILHSQIAQEIAAASREQVVICDRSVLDNYAYLVHRAGRRPSYDALVAEWVRTYALLCKVPIVSAPTFDGHRDTSTEFQGAVDRIIDHLLEDFSVPCLRLDAAEREGWVDAVLHAVGLPARPPQIDLFSRSAP